MHRSPGKEGNSHRVKIILQYVQSVEKGELPHNHEIMRQVIHFQKYHMFQFSLIFAFYSVSAETISFLQIRALSHRLPVLESDRFSPEFYTQVPVVPYYGETWRQMSESHLCLQ
jgi:hypothetical protein